MTYFLYEYGRFELTIKEKRSRHSPIMKALDLLCPNCNCSSSTAFWQVDNLVGTFLPADPATPILMGKAYEARHFKYNFLKAFPSPYSI